MNKNFLSNKMKNYEINKNFRVLISFEVVIKIIAQFF